MDDEYEIDLRDYLDLHIHAAPCIQYQIDKETKDRIARRMKKDYLLILPHEHIQHREDL